MLSREEQAEHNPEHDMEIEDTDKQNRDAAGTLEPNMTTQPPLYDDDEMELSND